ncbi:LCP family protein [Streptomyces zhihengii]
MEHPSAAGRPRAPGGARRPGAAPGGGRGRRPPSRRRRRPEPGDRDYRTEQFAFIEEPDEDSEDVIDWLKFTESRSERREEAKRRGRNRVLALAVVLALALVGGVGYLWYAGKLPGLSDAKTSAGAAAGPQKRDVIVVHLHNTKSEKTSTALLVDNVTTRQGTTVLLPNTLSVANDDGTATTLGKSVEDDGSTGTREAIGTLLGAEISGTWRLDTPYLENLVELVGTIDLTTDTAVPAAKKGDAPLVGKGENQTLDGRAAVAYATWSAPGEAEEKQLQRFGQVMQAVLKKLPDDGASATVIVETLGQILDPSLNEKDLGSPRRSRRARQGGDYKTALLPVQQNGTLTEEAANSVVKDVLGGSVSAPEAGAAVRVGVRNASGDGDATEKARISLVNGGYTVIDGGTADTAGASRVTYADDAHKAKAEEVAKTLGLPASAVGKGKAATNADVSVVLGSDFKGSGTAD